MKHFAALCFLGVLLLRFTIPGAHAQTAKATFQRAVVTEVIPQRPSKVQGGDYDDKQQRISLRVKMANRDLNQKFENLKCTVAIFGQYILDPKAFRVLLKEEFSLSVDPRAAKEHQTAEAMTAYDTTGAKFGAKYDGWVLIVKNSEGEVVYVKATSSVMEKIAMSDPAKVAALQKDGTYSRELTNREPPRF